MNILQKYVCFFQAYTLQIHGVNVLGLRIPHDLKWLTCYEPKSEITWMFGPF